MPDRPIECAHCKKGIKVIYKEIIDDTTTCSEMCADCPFLAQKLHGTTEKEKTNQGLNVKGGLCCEHCHTPLDAIRMGDPLGCGECYNVFSDVIVSELLQTAKIPPALRKTVLGKKVPSLHLGRSPHHASGIAPATKLTALHEALNDAVKKENYEQAAWIRDQIKSLIGQSYETSH